MKTILLFIVMLFFAGCLGVPKKVTPVKKFELNRYLGKWYEIARLDHSFERGLERVTAEYSMRDDGGVKVVNRGYSPRKKKWKEAEGKAYFVSDKTEGYLKVAFFASFYGSYVIFELDEKDYQYAFVCGYNKSYLWLLARTSTVDDALKAKFVKKAKELGFDTDNLLYPDPG